MTVVDAGPDKFSTCASAVQDVAGLGCRIESPQFFAKSPVNKALVSRFLRYDVIWTVKGNFTLRVQSNSRFGAGAADIQIASNRHVVNRQCATSTGWSLRREASARLHTSSVPILEMNL
jgi:hypothetical protein